MPRDEDTRAGNIIAQGEQDIRQRVVAQFSRISNRDVRLEFLRLQVHVLMNNLWLLIDFRC